MDPGELEQLIDFVLRQHGPALRLYAATWTQSPDDAVQKALIKLASSQPLPDNTVAWLYRVVRNESISAARSEKRRRKRERKVATKEAVFVATKSDPFDERQLTQALETLTAEIREVIVAKIWGGQSFEQIGKLAGCSSSAAHRRYSNGLKQLQTALVQDNRNHDEVIHR